MRIPELYKEKKPVFSLEIFPPKRKTNLESLYETVEQLAGCDPDFISVTYGAGGNIADNSTCEIASNIKKNYGIETVAHLTCVNSTREDVQEMIARFRDADIENVMALRGDTVPGEEIKREFYRLLSELTGRDPGWGTLTGLRPLKLAYELLNRSGNPAGMEDLLREIYLVSDNKISLLREIVDYQIASLHGDPSAKAGLYIGIPFCPTRCEYCAFASNVAPEEDIEE